MLNFNVAKLTFVYYIGSRHCEQIWQKFTNLAKF